MDPQHESKVALVTGAASGLGRATAQLFAERKAKVVVADINEAGGAETARLIADRGGEAIFVRADISVESDVRAMVEAAVRIFGRLDYAVNNAATNGKAGLLTEQTTEAWDRVIAVNLSGTFFCMKHEIPVMVRQGSGAIVNVSSVAGLRGDRGMAPYTASKHGINGLTKVAAIEYAAAGIRVNALCPGGILTPMLEDHFQKYPETRAPANKSTPMGRLSTPEEMARTVVWLCSDDASYINGHELAVDGGTSASVLFTGMSK